MKYKIELMHKMFGITPDKQCKDCSHFMEFKHQHKTYRKCWVYGNTASDSTDWAMKHQACGQFNIPYNGTKIIFQKNKLNKQIEQLDNQIRLEM